MQRSFVVPYLIVTLLVIFSIRYAVSQDCSALPSQSTLEGLMSFTLKAGENPTPPNVTILELNYVCLSSGMFRDTFNGISFVARYECVGRCPGGNSAGDVFTSQFDFSCGPGDEWIAEVRGTSEFSRRDVADANLTTPNRTDCSFCLSPDHPDSRMTPVIPRYDSITHCVACGAACNQGAMRCFGFGNDQCCNFFDRTDRRCLNECPSDTLPNDDFECTGFLAFSSSLYVFSEEQGTGSIQIDGTAGLVVRVVGDTDRNMADVVPSGTPIDTIVTSPAIIEFTITNDDVAVELNESYPVTMIPNDTSVVIRERMTTIVIVDDVDRMELGFQFANNIRVEGNMTAVPVRINGESIRDFFFDYLQEGAPQVPLTAMAGDYSEADFIRAPIINPDDEIALQDDRIFNLGLRVDPEFVDDVELGAVIGSDQTFVIANLTVQDDDVVTVSFDPESYTVSESGSRLITLSLDRGIATPFMVTVEPVQIGPLPAGLEPSIPTETYNVIFPLSNVPQTQSFLLTPVNDGVPSEPDEVIGLTFTIISDSRVRSDDDAEVTIIDDDDLGDVGFSVPSYTFIENERFGVVTVEGPANFPSTLSVRLVGGPGRQPGSVITSGSNIDQVLNGFPASVQFNITDDEAALEAVERYSLSLIPSDPSITINQATAEISIIDDDVIILGFPYEEMTFPASAVGNATVNVFGTAQQPFTVNYVQELGSTTPLQFAARDYPAGFTMDLPLSFPRNPDGPQNYFFMIGLTAVSDGVQVGGVISDPQDLLDPLTVFAIANITIFDDTVIVGFQDPEYTFSENPSPTAAVIVIRNIVSDTTLTLEVSAETMSDPFVEPSAIPSFLAGMFDFGAGLNTSYLLDIQNDGIALEDDEISTLSLSSPFDSRVMVGGIVDGVEYFPTTRVTITDDELVVIRIEGGATRSVSEGDSIDICVSKNIESIRTVNFTLTPEPRTAGVQDFSPMTVQSGSLPEDAVSDQVCFTFSASVDSVEDDSETFLVSLQSTDDDGRISEQNSQVTITIRDTTPPTPTPTPTPPGVDVEDTVIGDPLFTVPLPNSQHLCYEIRGKADQYFNFISDSCVSVNAHYDEHNVVGETKTLHVVDEIAIRAVDNNRKCVNILVDRNGCTASVDDSVTTSYSVAGISVREVDNKIVVNVPNCIDTDLEMEIICETMNGIDMIRFEVTRGINLRETSHGLLGQFWNVAISIEEFTGDFRPGTIPDNIVLVTLTPSQNSSRTFPAWQEQKTWDNRKTCLYAGNQNGGTVYEVVDGHDALIEGVYKDYITDTAFSTEFRFSQFDNNLCS